MAIKVLLADDEERWRMITRDFLENEGYEVLEAADGAQALQLMRDNSDVALVSLDLMMPVMNGIEACKKIREFSPVPILMVTARDDEQSELEGFGGGADDYVSKPVKMRPFMARVKALLKRTVLPTEQLEIGPLTMDFSASCALLEGQRLALTPKEYDLLCYLAQNRNVAKTREQILHAVWNTDFFGDARTVDTHVKNLRMKLGPACELIRTVRGRGYILEYRA